MEFARNAGEVTATADRALATAEELVQAIVGADERTWTSTLAPLDEAANVLAIANGSAAFLGYVHDDPAVRDAGRAAGERIQRWLVGLPFREDLADAITTYAGTDEAASLTGEHARFLAHLQRDLHRAGHGLDPDARAELQRNTERLVEVGVAFERNLAEHEDALVVTPEDLAGLPDGYLEGLPPGEQDGTFRVTMTYPHVLPFLDRADRRDLRRELDRRYNNRARTTNQPLLAEAVQLRARNAELLGHDSWAHHQLEVRMADGPEAVAAFYDDLLPPLTAAAREDLAQLQAMLAEDTGDPDVVVQRWDWRYYHARRQREQGVDAAEVAAYFSLEGCIDGLFDLVEEVFGVSHAPLDVPTWSDEVRSYELRDRDSGAPLATVHLDLHPRDGTYTHAAAFTLTPGRRLPDGSYQRPVSAIVANLPRATADRPALLEHPQVETWFHEYGHILHQLLTRAELTRFSGTAVERDFVEAPSQIMQHWTWDRDVLTRFARHHATGAPIPTELVDALIDARNLDVALRTLRQVHFGWLDLQLHGPEGPSLDLEQVTADAAALTLLPKPAETLWPVTFAHIVSGGYSAGYYGYLWAEVIGDDLFRRFQEEGITSPDVGASYRREILETGHTRDADEHVRAFLGREPDNTAFLRKLGIG